MRFKETTKMWALYEFLFEQMNINFETTRKSEC